MASIIQKAEEMWEKGKKKIERYICYFCGKRYFRRDQYIIWHITQDELGVFNYERQTIRVCLECASEDRPRKFSRMVIEARTHGARH